ELSARLQDRRPDLATRRLRWRRAPDANRSRDRTSWGCVGDEQLAGHRQLLQKRQRGVVDPLRRPGCDRLPWDGEARARAADRTGAAVLASWLELWLSRRLVPVASVHGRRLACRRMLYRVIVWGTGNVGRAALRTVIANPALELVGVI